MPVFVTVRALSLFSFFICLERKDAEGWETVQRGRPVRSRSTVVMPKVLLATDVSRSKDDSDKENVHLSPGEITQKGEFIGDGPSGMLDSLPKDLSHSCDHPLTERTQVVHLENSFLSF